MILAEDLIAKEDFPEFHASVMDGYAIKHSNNNNLY